MIVVENELPRKSESNMCIQISGKRLKKGVICSYIT